MRLESGCEVPLFAGGATDLNSCRSRPVQLGIYGGRTGWSWPFLATILMGCGSISVSARI